LLAGYKFFLNVEDMEQSHLEKSDESNIARLSKNQGIGLFAGFCCW
jgi:hypothetical protein